MTFSFFGLIGLRINFKPNVEKKQALITPVLKKNLDTLKLLLYNIHPGLLRIGLGDEVYENGKMAAWIK
jgi:hypothetical protein